jgi:hypothetical protein
MDLEKDNIIIPEKNPLKEKIIDNITEVEVESKETDKTFNRLKELQDLLKKESALKELCKQKTQFYNIK